MTSDQIFDRVRTSALALVVATTFVIAAVQLPPMAIAMLLGFVTGCIVGAGYALWLIVHTSPTRDKGRRHD